MADENTPYIQRNPGDIWTAEDWNGVQTKIKDDIRGKIDEATKQITKTGVQRADSADKFAEKTPDDWVKDLDGRYAQKVHDHEGQAVYRAYHKRFTKDTPSAFLEHKLGRFPLVDVYELQKVPFNGTQDENGTIQLDEGGSIKSSDNKPIKFFLYYHHEEADKFGLDVKVYRDRARLGVPLKDVLAQYGVEWEDDDTLQDVRNDLWDKLFALPNDEISHSSSPWIESCCIERTKIGRLKSNDEWQDIRLAFRPVKCEAIFCGFIDIFSAVGEAIGVPKINIQSRKIDKTVERSNLGLMPLRISHVNYETLLVEVANPEIFLPNDDSFVDVMLLLRI
ncbi:MAG: hypothetical protein LUO89_09230 [Methanothrix sp.]|nr:hypothetical protein [Methanothrix sp.]